MLLTNRDKQDLANEHDSVVLLTNKDKQGLANDCDGVVRVVPDRDD